MSDTTPYLSIVSPVYGAEKIVDELVRRVVEEAAKVTDNFELVLVEDGSPDRAWDKIAKNAQRDPRVKGIKLSRNFGQHYALTAGLEAAKGDYVIVMDCDLQDDPRYIHDLVARAKEGYDIVYTYKKERKHARRKNLLAQLFFWVFNWLVDAPESMASKNVGSFSLITRKVVEAYHQVNDYERHYLMVLRWLGFSKSYVEIEHQARFEGRSSYTTRKLIAHAISGIVTQSDKLLHLNIYIGFTISAVALLAAFGIVVFYFVNGFRSGWASIFVMLLFMLGVLLVSIGIVGVYLGKTYEQTKGRPKYIIDKTENL